MNRKKPRDYQKDIISQAVNSKESTLIQIPTGGGKTFIAYEIATDLIAKFDQQVLFVAPRENLVHQTAEEFKFARPHIVHSSNKKDKDIKTYDSNTYPLLISTLQTAYRRENINPDVIIIDETHFGFDGKMINKLIESNKHSRIIGLSATPYDKYGRQLQGFDLVLDKYDMRYMIENKYLVPLKSYKRQKIKGLEKIKITQGDYDIGELEQVVCNNHTIMEIAETTKDKIAESEKTIVFAVTIKHADLLAEAYKNAGFTARSLHSKSQESDAETIDHFKKGNIKVLVSVSKLTTGFDVPSADCAVIARPTKSQNLYKQMVGRILRLSPETHKIHAVLLDCGNVIDTLGDPLAPIKLIQPKESDNKLKCNVCQSENLKLKKIDNKSFWECQNCGHLKKIKEGTYKCNYCNKYSNRNSKFIFTETKILLDCDFCNTKTIISEFLGDEALVHVEDADYAQVKNYDKYGFDENGIHEDTGYFTDKYGNQKSYYIDKIWMQKIWDWADENDIPDPIKSEGSTQGLPRNKNELLNMTYLDLSNCELNEFPKEIGNLINLTILVLDSNYLTEIPKEVFNLTNLTGLSLSDTGISVLPKEIGNLVNLRELYLDNNSLMEIPVEIGRLINLRYLDLHYNELAIFPKEIGNFVNLIELNFSSNELSTLPKEFFNLVNLVKLDLGGNKIIFLSNKIGNLIELEIINLQGNDLVELPNTIFNLRNLTELNLDNKKLTKLPKEIGNLTCLQKLHLQNNALTELPKEIGNLTALRQLYLQNNDLAGLPKEIFNLTNLVELDLENNKLIALSSNIGNLINLEMINLEGNKLTELPKEIGNLINLSHLHLRDNKLTELPKEIGNLVNWKQVNLQDNNFTEVPKGIFDLTNLIKLNLKNNELTKLPTEIESLVILENLHLQNNALINLPKEIGSLTELHLLYLQNNALTELPKEIGNLTGLRQLYLQNNALIKLPKEIENLKHLNHFGFMENEKLILTETQNDWISYLLDKNCNIRLKSTKVKKSKTQNTAKINSPITQDEFEQLFKSKTEIYLQKKEKSFSDPLDFEEFLESEQYKQINITRRKQILEGYELIDSTTSETYNTSKEVPSVQKNYYDEHGFDKDGIHKDTGYLTDKYGNHKDYYTHQNKSST